MERRLRGLGRPSRHRRLRCVRAEADVVAQGPNNTLMYYWAFPGHRWHSAQIAGTGTTFIQYLGVAPGIAVRSSGEADVVAVGPNNTLMYYWALFAQQWNPTQITVTGTTFCSPAIVVRSSGEADIVAQGPNSLIYYWAFPGERWNWVPIG